MKEMKTYKVILAYEAFSKKKGIVQKKIVIAKDLPSPEEAKKVIAQRFPSAVFVDGKQHTAETMGSLYTSHIFVK